MRFIGIIPARLNSTRLPRKPLVDLCGKPMIQHVYERAKKCLDIVYVATDHTEIFDTVHNFGGKAIMTPANCNSGTDRCYWAYKKIVKFIEATQDDVIINIQGDQPLLHKEHIVILKYCFTHDGISDREFATIAYKDEFAPGYSFPLGNCAYVVFDKDKKALYFSRYPLPYGSMKHFKHIGIYGYSPFVLKKFHELPQSYLEIAERLEQNRWLEEGYRIKVGITAFPSESVDTEEDLRKVSSLMKILGTE